MDTLSLYIITWNLAEQLPPSGLDLTELLSLNKKKELMPDLYIVGLQEAKVDLLTGQWGSAFRNKLKEYNYIEINCARLLGIVMYVFAREQHITKVRNMETGSTATGLLGILGNKGAVTVRMDLYGMSVCLVNSHLAAHDGHLEERVASYNTIVDSQKFKLNTETTTIFFHDYVFWHGDLNFRLKGDATPAELSAAIARGELDELWRQDELSHVRASGQAFSELHEERPTFPPTYKNEFGKTLYSKSRRPAWTDRVLYKVNKDAYQNLTLDVKQTSYNSVPSYTVSDHKPVFAEFSIKVFSHYSDREVAFSPVGTWYIDEDNCAACSLPSDHSPSIWDWVGVFEGNLTNLHDYVSYIYVPNQRSDKSTSAEPRVKLRFPAGAVREPGTYRLLYFTRGGSSLLGISEPFNAIHRNGQPSVSTSRRHIPVASTTLLACKRAASNASCAESSGQVSPSPKLEISSMFLLLAACTVMFCYYLNIKML